MKITPYRLFAISLSVFLFSNFLFASPSVTSYEELLTAIRQTRTASEQRIEAAVEAEKVREAYETGKLIDAHILLQKERQKYGEQVVERLAKDLKMDRSELVRMVEFARAYPISVPGHQLSWSHWKALLAINHPEMREEYAEKAEKEKWTRDKAWEEVGWLKSKNPDSPEKSAQGGQESKEINPGGSTQLTPGKVGVYRIIRPLEGPYANDLVLDLGFANYFKMGNMNEFREGDLVYVKPVKQSKKGLATRYQFEKVITAPKPDQIHIAVKKNPIYGDESMLFTYEAYTKPEWITDGDTLWVLIDLGFGFTTKQKLRLKGLDAPEILPHEMSKSRQQALGPQGTSVISEGLQAKFFLESAIAKAGGKILIKTVKSDKYDRYLADVWIENNVYMNQELLDKDLAVRVQE